MTDGKYNIYEDITKKIVLSLSRGEIPWHKRWCSPVDGKVNYVSRRSYGGVNLLLLESPGEYLTFNQCKSLGGNVRKGEQSHTVYLYFPYVPKDRKEEYERRKARGEYADDLTVPVLKYLRVFHLSQTEGLQSRYPAPDHTKAKSPTDIADMCLGRLSAETGITWKEQQRDTCSADGDVIALPCRSQFPCEEQWYSTLFSLCAQCLVRKEPQNNAANPALEALTCEMAASMAMAGVEMEMRQTQEDTLMECSRWATELSRDYRLIVTAACRAQKLAERILQPILKRA